ncbi:MAG: hypothetical protein JKX81_05450 [Arenicella sp.]|nr:hypothetical protein [Arenicella sp.]
MNYGLQEDVADEFKRYADFDELQEQKIDLIAAQLETAWTPIERYFGL